MTGYFIKVLIDLNEYACIKNECGTIERGEAMEESFTYLEFFAGGGMARAGLGSHWACLYANDFDHKKGQVYEDNWGSGELVTADIRSISADSLPTDAELAWGSFPCQDLSLAGGGAGLKGERSGTFYPFWDLIGGLRKRGAAPPLVALENVCGTLTSHKRADFAAICSTFREHGYRAGALVVDAQLFLPHSRPRLFFIGIKNDVPVPASLISQFPSDKWHPQGLKSAYAALRGNDKTNWLWWRLPHPPKRTAALADIIEEHPTGVRWHTREETTALLGMMSKINLTKVELARAASKRMVGGIYKRTRMDERGLKVQRAEVRFDDVSGCLRTPVGGSSRQLILVVDGQRIRSRLISTRETARLMGLPDSYTLPSNYNEGYHLTGDGVAVPVVRHLAHHLLEPLVSASRRLVAA